MHTIMRLAAFAMLLGAAILWLSFMKGSEETAADLLNGVVPELAEIGFYPERDEIPAVQTLTEFDEHWMRQYSPSILQGVESINVLSVRKSEPVGVNFYPDAVIEIWVYGNGDQPGRAVAMLDSLRNATLTLRAPAEWWSHDNWMIYTRTSAEMFRPHLEEVAGLLRQVL